MKLHYQVAGYGQPVVLTSGIGHTSSVWSSLVESMVHGVKTVCWDHRGHGQSEKSDNPDDYSRDLAVADLSAMISVAGGDENHPAVLVGHSLGGYLSLCTAIQNPKLIKALVLISTGPGFRDAVARESWNQYALAMDIGGAAHPAARQLGVQTDSSVIENLKTLTMPTLVIVGSEDKRFLGGKDYLVSKMPDATGMVIEGGRHSVHITHADQVNQAILDFLNHRCEISSLNSL